MNVKIFIFVIICIRSIHSISDIHSVKVKVISQSRFEAPIDTQLIESLTNIRSSIMCSVLCERHSICRTAEYNPTNKVCRLFETLSSMGTLLADPTTSVLALNYCKNDKQTEPEYICTRSDTFTVQQIFDKLISITKMNLSTSDRGAYANMYGVYTSSYHGDLSFFTYTGVKTILAKSSSEVTNVNSALSNGLVIVRYSDQVAIIYKNVGTSSEPQLVPALNLSLFAQPYSCVMTPQYLYITYLFSSIVMTIHNISTGLTLYIVPSRISVTYRPVAAQWNDTIIILDQYQAVEFTLTGVYKRDWTYFSGYQGSTRHYIHYDYAGRRYTCNSGGTNPGIYVFLQNDTQLAHGPSDCTRAFQVYLTKDQVMFMNTPSTGASMQIINF